MAEKQHVGTGEGGLVVPGDLDDPPKEETAAPGNEESLMVEAAAALGNGADSGATGKWLPCRGQCKRVPVCLKTWIDRWLMRRLR